MPGRGFDTFIVIIFGSCPCDSFLAVRPQFDLRMRLVPHVSLRNVFASK